MLSLSKHTRHVAAMVILLLTAGATAEAPLELPPIDHVVVRKAEPVSYTHLETSGRWAAM